MRLLLAILALALCTAVQAQAPTKIKFILNWKFYGP